MIWRSLCEALPRQKVSLEKPTQCRVSVICHHCKKAEATHMCLDTERPMALCDGCLLLVKKAQDAEDYR